MTALVGILNKHAVALAADSAVTIGDIKIFNTLKLFALSKRQPVGIMVYSSADVMGVPSETVIKEFRRVQGRQSYEHLEGYAEAFEEYLRTDNTLFTDDARRQGLEDTVSQIIEQLRVAWLQRLEAIVKRSSWGHPTKTDAKRALSATVTELERRIQRASPLAGSLQAHLISAAMDQRVTDELRSIERSVPMDTAQKDRIRQLILDSFQREINLGGNTGFVIAGFGTADVFPRLRAFSLYCSSPEVHKVMSRVTCDISDNRIAEIRGFAQTDVMVTFVEGKDPVYNEALARFLNGFFREKKRTLMNASPPQAREAKLVESIGKELAQELEIQTAELTRRTFTRPTMNVVAAMPKEELAALAEALINLTALKRKASHYRETVGGPTDVAVISKGDGFVWIKRKHYFDPKINPVWSQVYLEDDDG